MSALGIVSFVDPPPVWKSVAETVVVQDMDPLRESETVIVPMPALIAPPRVPVPR
jgi:hypothetical protein